MKTKTSQEIIPVEVRRKAEAADGLAKKFASITISNQDQYETAAIDLKGIKLESRELDEKRKSITGPIDNAKKVVMDFFRPHIDALEAAADHIKAAMLNYQQAQERIRIAEENRLREMQRQLEDKLRQEAEAKRAEEERLCREAEAALAAGDQKQAEAIITKAEAVSAAADAAEQTMGVLVQATPTVESTVTKVAGVATRKVWSYEIVDPMLIPRDYLKPDDAKIGQVVRATKGTLAIPGVKIIGTDIIAA